MKRALILVVNTRLRSNDHLEELEELMIRNNREDEACEFGTFEKSNQDDDEAGAECRKRRGREMQGMKVEREREEEKEKRTKAPGELHAPARVSESDVRTGPINTQGVHLSGSPLSVNFNIGS